MKGEREGRVKGKEKKITDSSNGNDENKTGHCNRVIGQSVCLASLDWEISDGLSEEAPFGET